MTLLQKHKAEFKPSVLLHRLENKSLYWKSFGLFGANTDLILCVFSWTHKCLTGRKSEQRKSFHLLLFTPFSSKSYFFDMPLSCPLNSQLADFFKTFWVDQLEIMKQRSGKKREKRQKHCILRVHLWLSDLGKNGKWCMPLRCPTHLPPWTQSCSKNTENMRARDNFKSLLCIRHQLG